MTSGEWQQSSLSTTNSVSPGQYGIQRGHILIFRFIHVFGVSTGLLLIRPALWQRKPDLNGFSGFTFFGSVGIDTHVCVCAPAMNNCYVPFKMSFNGPKQLPMKSWQSLPLPHIYAIVVKSISHLGWFNSYKRSTCVLVPIFRKRDSGQILWNVCGPLKLNTSFRMFLIYI